MTPDANPLLGPLPGVRGFWVAAGLSLNGFGGGGGIGRAMAGWITAGDPGRGHRAVSGVAVRRRLPRPGVRGGPWPRDVLRLLPASLPVRRGPRRAPATALRAPWAPPGGGRGVRHQGRLGACRLPSSRAVRGAAPGATRPSTAGPGRPGSTASARRRGPSASGRGSSTSRRSARSRSRGRERSGSSSG